MSGRRTPAVAASVLVAVTIAVVLGATSPARSAETRVNATGCTSSKGKLRYGIAGAGIAQLDPEHDQLRGPGAAADAALQRPHEVRPQHEGRPRPRNVVALVGGPEDVVVHAAQGREVLERPCPSPPTTSATTSSASSTRRSPSQQRANAKDIRSVRIISPTLIRMKLGSPSALLPNALVDIKMSDTKDVENLAKSGNGHGPVQGRELRPEPVVDARPEPVPLRRQGVPAGDRVRPRAGPDRDGDGLQGGRAST